MIARYDNGANAGSLRLFECRWHIATHWVGDRDKSCEHKMVRGLVDIWHVTPSHALVGRGDHAIPFPDEAILLREQCLVCCPLSLLLAFRRHICADALQDHLWCAEAIEHVPRRASA